jgi:hypothetical protein
VRERTKWLDPHDRQDGTVPDESFRTVDALVKNGTCADRSIRRLRERFMVPERFRGLLAHGC